MDFRVNQNNRNRTEEREARDRPNDAADYAESFEELAEARMFEELANAQEREEGEDIAAGDHAGDHTGDYVGADSGGAGGQGNGSSNGHQRVLDYWAAQKEAEVGAIGAQAALTESTGGSKGRLLTSENIPLLNLTAEEEAELARAAEAADALAFLEDDEDADLLEDQQAMQSESVQQEFMQQESIREEYSQPEPVSALQAEDLLAQFLLGREQQRIEQRQQEMLDMVQKFQSRLDGLTQMAGQQGFMGAFMFMGLGAGGFALSPTVDRRGLLVEKAKENLKGAGGKGDSKKSKDGPAINQDVQQALDEEMVFKTASTEDELSLSHEDLMAASKEAFRERFGQWLAIREAEMGEEDDQMFIAQMLQSYDQFTLSEHGDSAYLHPLWLSAMELMLPQTLLSQCENALKVPLPALNVQLARYAQKTPVLSQNALGDLTFDPPFAEALVGVSERLLRDTDAQQVVANTQADAFALLAQKIELPVVVVSFDGSGYSLLTPSPETDQLWCPLQVWDIDWTTQRHLILLEGDRFRFLRRQF